jgi:glycosyltransferase involved in cell wall biosynthesis
MRHVVSVIVPAFNVAPYIEECLASLLVQEIPVEIIVVNDGSTDDTSTKVQAIKPHSIHSIVLIDQENCGPSAARNVGLSRATGRFVGFCDGDDWVESDAYASLVAAAIQSKAELVICNGRMVDHKTRARQPFQDNHRLNELAKRYRSAFDPHQVPDAFMLDVSACKRLYLRSWLEEIAFRFADGLYFEDTLAHFQLLMKSSSMVLVNRTLYNARVNRPGRMSQRTDGVLLDVLEILRRCEDTLRAKRASDPIWANFIWYQNWLLRWLASQIEYDHQQRFLNGVVSVGRQCAKRGLIEFQRKFELDDLAQKAVALQMFGWKKTFLSFARHKVATRDRQVLMTAAFLKMFAPFFGRRS